MSLTNTLYAPTFDFTLAVSDGGLPWIKPVSISAFCENLRTSEITVSDINTLVYYPTVATQLKITSTSALDTATSGGLRSVRVFGLDGNWDETSEVVNLAGLSPVLTTNAFTRAYRIAGMSAGVLATNVGDIWVGTGDVVAGVPENKMLKILSTYGKSLHGQYSVPRNKAVYITRLSCITAKKNGTVLIKIMIRPFGGIFLVGDARVVSETSGDVVIRTSISGRIDEKTDIEFRATSSDTGRDLSVYMFAYQCDILLPEELPRVTR